MAGASIAELLAVLPDAVSVATADLQTLLDRTYSVVAEFVGDGFADAGDRAARTFYGVGTAYLQIDAYDDSEHTIRASDVTMPSGFTVPAFAGRGLFLVATTSQGIVVDRPWSSHWFSNRSGLWPDGVPVTVMAPWGYTDTPGDIKEAHILTTVAAFRESYAPQAGAWASPVGTSFDLPPRAREILTARLARRLRVVA